MSATCEEVVNGLTLLANVNGSATDAGVGVVSDMVTVVVREGFRSPFAQLINARTARTRNLN